MPDKYITELFLNIINELARNNLINQEAWKKDVEKLQVVIGHAELVEKAQREEYSDSNTAMTED